MKRFVCVHGHFYQPPRENAWLERVERQESARPFHDWNERIESECYGPNARARILDDEDHVIDMVNNFAKMSFNVGPTLLSWLEAKAPQTYARILAADVESTRAMGHGSAMAQAYGHLILPLATPRDRRTQVRWGVADFRRRFGRAPQGMWLPETAACTDSLRALAEHGIEFTVLAPSQAKAIRLEHETAFVPTSEGGLDTRRPYRVDLGGGLSIAVFFYDGATSQAVAFERLLSNGDAFANRLYEGFSREAQRPELVHIATDGETYGHHHRFGEMALAYAFRRIERDPDVTLTNYASFLATHPPKDEATIVENSSWSCAHGVGRWSADCGCRTAPEKNQAWRGPLRAGLDWLRDAIDAHFEASAKDLLEDPWQARDEYIDVVLDRRRDNVQAFLVSRAARALDAADGRKALMLLEMQRHRMLMYTSCGWFFDDVDGLETTQILQYAGRAVELARMTGGPDLEQEIVGRLKRSHATTPHAPTASAVYERTVSAARVDARRLAGAFAVTSLFGISLRDVPAFEVVDREVRTAKRDDQRFASGRLEITNLVTRERIGVAFAVHHAGGPAVIGGMRLLENGAMDDSDEPERWITAFEEEPQELDARMTAELPMKIDSLRVLPLDERVLVVERILASAVRAAETAYRQVFTGNAVLLTELAATGVKPPRALTAATRVVLEADLLRAVRRDPPDTRALRNLLAESRAENVPFDEATLVFELAIAIDRTTEILVHEPGNDSALGRLIDLVEIARKVRPSFDLSGPQDLVWTVLHEPSTGLGRAASEAGRMGAWRELAKELRVRPVLPR